MKCLGIDPGLRITGYGCIRGAAPDLVEAGVFRLTTEHDGDRVPVADRLLELHRDITELLERLSPDIVGVESLFAHYKHPATAIAMGHARGVILLAVRAAGLRLVELKPNEIKKFLTGNGHASKEQMQGAVQARLRLAQRPEPPDVADAIAIAMCVGSREAIPIRAGSRR
jgi:crossover junction endodeoxyribonuclease RuvC